MTSSDAAGDPGDAGLLSPVRVGTAVEAATGDHAVLQALLDAEAALARAQADLGLAPRSAAEAIERAARAEEFEVRELALRARAGGNPVIPLVGDLTAAVARADPEAAVYVHRGATSQDILDTALMLVAARGLRPVLADLERTAAALARLAAEHRGTPMPGRTLTQHAVPTVFGLKAAGWRSLVLDAHDRLTALAHGGLPAQLGGAAGTLAAFAEYAANGADPEPAAGRAGTEAASRDEAGPPPVGPAGTEAGRDDASPGDAGLDDTGPDDAGPDDAGPAAGGRSRGDIGLRLSAAYAREVGLAEPGLPWHTLRTPVADLGAALAFAAGALGKVAADVLVLSRTEIGEVAEGSGGGSSAMPHKSNPVRATLIASAARQVPALAAVLLGSLTAEDERPAGAWHAEWQPLRAALRLVGGAAEAAAELAEGLRVFPYRMREHLDLTDGLIVSERFAAALGPVVGRDRAKRLLTAASRRAVDEGIALYVALEETAQEQGLPAGLLAKERLRELADPARYVGSAAALVDRALRRTPRTTPKGFS
ncbi:lyase family protein [Streptomyces sp. NPDC048106]|uniref:lyase family protein n=1 Tax=Streptomyces sp. NPDC048106 TaxID=3155750 RepID=UPI0034517FDD